MSDVWVGLGHGWAKKYTALVARMEALAAEADAGGDHPTAARIRAALWDDEGGPR